MDFVDLADLADLAVDLAGTAADVTYRAVDLADSAADLTVLAVDLADRADLTDSVAVRVDLAGRPTSPSLPTQLARACQAKRGSG